MTRLRVSLAALATVLLACSVGQAWQNGAGAAPQLRLWGGQPGWGQSHFQFAPPVEYGAITTPPPQIDRQQRQRFQEDLSQWRPGLVTPSWWRTVGRPVPIPQPSIAPTQQPAARPAADTQGIAPPTDGQPVQVAPQRPRSRVLEFNPQSGKLEEANITRW